MTILVWPLTLWDNLHVTGAFSYRAASFGEGTTTYDLGDGEVEVDEETLPPVQVTSWSLTADINSSDSEAARGCPKRSAPRLF